MKQICYILFFISLATIAQQPIEISLVKKTDIVLDTLVTVDNFGTIFYLKDNVILKKTKDKTITYNNLQLGHIASANAFNPLKINLLYSDFNTVIILDNRLAEIFKIDFNALSPYKNVSHISTGHDNTIWLFNQDLQKLELFDYKTRTNRAQTVPVQSRVLDLKSNYNFCWLLTKNYLYVYNYFGSLIKKIKNIGYTALTETNEDVILKREDSLFYLKKNSHNIIPINTGNLLISQFFATNETLYIYGSKTLQEFQLKIN
jgi:hypothetical protein